MASALPQFLRCHYFMWVSSNFLLHEDYMVTPM